MWDSSIISAYHLNNNVNDDKNTYNGTAYNSPFSNAQAYSGNTFSCYGSADTSKYIFLPNTLTPILGSLNQYNMQWHQYQDNINVTNESIIWGLCVAGGFKDGFSVFPTGGGHPFAGNYVAWYNGGYSFIGINANDVNAWVRWNWEYKGTINGTAYNQIKVYKNGTIALTLNSTGNSYKDNPTYTINLARWNISGYKNKTFFNNYILSGTCMNGLEIFEMPDNMKINSRIIFDNNKTFNRVICD